jgi:hypothetical protein
MLQPPFQQVWVKWFEQELVPTHTEPIVVGDLLYIGTYSGMLRCLEVPTGRIRWSQKLGAPILHSVSWGAGRVFVPAANGLWAVDGFTGQILWHFPGTGGGFSSNPAVTEQFVLCGSRDGHFYALDPHTGQLRWSLALGVPLCSSPAVKDHVVVFAAEDMRVYAADILAGKLLWQSETLWGQSFRDAAPILLGDKVIIRTCPAENFGRQVAADTAFLAKQAGLPDHSWKTIDEYLRSPRIFASSEQIRQEQAAIRQRLQQQPSCQTFFILDLGSGKQSVLAPVLYTGGCAGVGNLPVVGPEEKLVVVYRTAFTNFSLGVAPFVGVGLLDLQTGDISPIYHQHGSQPPWNTFWGTADEAQSMTSAGQVVYFCHQGTLSLLDLVTRRLTPIAGERDSWGGLRNLPWALNEWHGPARASLVIAGEMMFWQTGSRIIALRGTRH